MEKIPFRDKPKIADLTSERRLAEKVSSRRRWIHVCSYSTIRVAANDDAFFGNQKKRNR